MPSPKNYESCLQSRRARSAGRSNPTPSSLAAPALRALSPHSLPISRSTRPIKSPTLAALTLALSIALSGCVYRGAKIVEGTDLAIGLNVPSTDGTLQLQLLNYLSGFRLAVAENAALTVEYSTVASNSYFGVVQTQTSKSISATVQPCETSPNPSALSATVQPCETSPDPSALATPQTTSLASPSP